MVAYLSLVASKDDSLRLKRVINEPKRKIGSATVEAVEAIASQLGISMYTVMERAGEFKALEKSAEKLRSFVSLIEGVKEEYTLPSDMIKALFERSGYYDMLRAEGFEGEGKIENVNEFISAALEYEKRAEEADAEISLIGFLEEVFLISDLDKYDENADAVVLMTVHAAKGLEFGVVFLAGMEDGIFPGEQNIGDPGQMSEERRLAYVAITRAKDRLFVTYAKNRIMYGRTLWGNLSCFIRDELPEALVEREIPKRYGAGQSRPSYGYREENRFYADFTELRRPSSIQKKEPAPARRGAEGYGLERFALGTRVSHAMFGEGKIISVRDMGGDLLYEVAFDSGQTKKLMATFAKLKKI
jgi:DNA helicase-2/ATP-dependent DNA helicase PcrA